MKPTLKKLANGTKEWSLNGKLHREDGPAVEYDGDFKEWYLNGKRHREDGPAIEGLHAREWFLNGKRHREDGPAIEWSDGTKVWYLNDKRHRKDGPAVERADGTKEWCLDGVRYNFNEYLKKLEEMGIDIAGAPNIIVNLF